MGGKGSGGRRVGAGRKPKSLAEQALSGWAGKRKPRGQQQSDARTAAASLPILPPPDDISDAARRHWLRLAPDAAAHRTLTPHEAFAFQELCEAIVWRDRLKRQIEEDGLTFESRHVEHQAAGADREEIIESREIKKHPLLPDHRGWQQRVEAGMARFKLTPMGKEVVPAEAPKDEWADFEDPSGDSKTH